MESSFTTLSTVIEDMENEDSDLIDSDNDDEENSHLQFEETDWFQGVHQITGVVSKKNNLCSIKPLETGLRSNLL